MGAQKSDSDRLVHGFFNPWAYNKKFVKKKSIFQTSLIGLFFLGLLTDHEWGLLR